VTKQLVTLLHGSIDVESEKDEGTRFTIRLPKQRTSVGPERE